MNRSFNLIWRRWPLVFAANLIAISCGNPSRTPPKADDAKSAAPQGFKLPATGDLGLSELTNFAKQKRDFLKPDDFSKGFDDSPLFGRAFVVSVPVSPYSGSSTGPVEWNYNADTEELSFSIDNEDLGGAVVPTLVIQETTEFGAKKIMSNAFGKEVEVSPMETWTISLGRDASGPIGVFQKADADAFGIMSGYNNLQWAIKLAPTSAKALVDGMTVRLEGRVEKDSYGKTIACSDDHVAAKIDSPTEWNRHTCIIQARFSRIALMGKDGKTVKEWRDAPQKTKPAKVEPEIETSSLLDDVGDDVGSYVDADGSPIDTPSNETDY